MGEKSTNVYVEHQASIETSATEPKRPKPRGFAAMDPAKVSEIARKGGKAAHAAGTAHEFSPDEARVAGKKGGLAPHSRRGTQKTALDSPKGPTGEV